MTSKSIITIRRNRNGNNVRITVELDEYVGDARQRGEHDRPPDIKLPLPY